MYICMHIHNKSLTLAPPEVNRETDAAGRVPLQPGSPPSRRRGLCYIYIYIYIYICIDR